ncbi:MAG: two-component system NarL family sensor kinase [Crocinitomicaceae bacterium]|jgi:two-component system NarL family sensor kinase
MADKSSITLIIILSCLIMFMMFMTIIIFVVVQKRKVGERQRKYEVNLKNKELELLRAVIDTQEDERQKIARNLHDEINPLLSTLKLYVGKQLKDSSANQEILVKEKEIIDSVIGSIQTVTQDLSPHILHRYGLINALKTHLDSIEDTEAPFEVEFDEDQELSKIVELNTYRVALEIIQNIRKHDHPSWIRTALKIEKHLLTLIVRHDGVGITNEEFVAHADSASGIGLNSLKARTVLLKANLDYSKGEEASVVFTVPLNDE